MKNKVFISLVVLFIGIGIILIVQAMQTTTNLVYTPSELATEAATQSKSNSLPRVRVVGKIAPKEFKYQTEPTIQLDFKIQDPEGNSPKLVSVRYNKLMPDMFAPGRSVIIDGAYKDGILHAKNLMTQCPSKYKPPTPMDKMKGQG